LVESRHGTFLSRARQGSQFVTLISSVPAGKNKTRINIFARSLGVLYFLFFLSGISGLVYEVVWVRMLTRVLGNTVYATSTVLAAFMAGLALGSYAVGRFIDGQRRPLRWYAVLELGIGVTALATLTLTERLVPLYQWFHDFTGGARTALTAGQVAIALIILIVPTALMGASLPTLCAHGARQHATFSRNVGVLYGVNSLGAVIGILAGGFVLLGAVGETLTLCLAILLNLLVAAAAWLLSARQAKSSNQPAELANQSPEIRQPSSVLSYPAKVRLILLACFAISGFVALANEVVWSRMLQHYQGPSIYAFSSMLAVVLAGMGIGSLWGGRWVNRWRDPLRVLARVQLAVALAAAAALHLYSRQPYGLFLAPLVLLGPVSFFWGLAFPVGAACFSSSSAGAGRTISDLYSWNTLGCIAGSLAAGFVLVPWFGASRTGAILAGLNLALGLAILCAHPFGSWRHIRPAEFLLILPAALLLALVGDPYYRLLERKITREFPEGMVIYRHIEETAATTTAFGPPSGDYRRKQLWVNGIGMTVMVPATKLMAHLPLALAEDPHDMLVICFGMGTTVRSASRHEGLRVQIVELVPGVVKCFGCYHADGPDILRRPNMHVAVDDGRNHLLLHPETYDVITIDPPPPLYSAGAVNLYTREFFLLCRQHLRPGGIMCLWMPGESLAEVKMVLKTYLSVFDHVQVWAGPEPVPGILLTASVHEVQGLRERIRKLYGQSLILADLREWGSELDQPEKILDLYLSDERELSAFVAGSEILTDDTPYTEFPFWRSRQNPEEYRQLLTPAIFREFLKARAVHPTPP
jgi:spermidine synthase